MKGNKQKPTAISIICVFFVVGALCGAMTGLVEYPFHADLTKGPLVSPGIDPLLKALLFAGFYGCLFGFLGILGGLFFSLLKNTFNNRKPETLALFLTGMQILLMYVSVPINRKLPPIFTAKSIIVNCALSLAALAAALGLFYLLGKFVGRFFSRISPVLQKAAFSLSIFFCVAGIVTGYISTNAAPTYTKLPEANVEGPNVILVSVDTLRADHLPCYGYPHIQTPTVDRLAARGVVFENAYSTTAWTLPACATLMTGRTPRGLNMFESHVALPKSVETLAETMAKSGRATVGVTSNAFLTSGYGFDRGFDRLVTIFDNNLQHGLSGIYLFDNLIRLQSASDDAAHVTDLANRQLEDLKDRPFFMWVHYMDPHKPYGGPWVDKLPDYDKGYDGSINFVYGFRKPINELREPVTKADIQHVKALYDADIMHFDEHFARFIDKLDQLGLTENTIIAFVADHGEAFLEHDDWGHGQNLHTQQTHVPMIFIGPNIPNGLRISDISSILDLPATLCDLVGSAAPRTSTGQSLVPMFSGEPGRKALGELLNPSGRWASLRFGDGPGQMLLYDIEDGGLERYNRETDPEELHDLFSQNPKQGRVIFKEFRERLMVESAVGRTVGKSTGANIPPNLKKRLKALGYVVQ